MFKKFAVPKAGACATGHSNMQPDRREPDQPSSLLGALTTVGSNLNTDFTSVALTCVRVHRGRIKSLPDQRLGHVMPSCQIMDRAT